MFRVVVLAAALCVSAACSTTSLPRSAAPPVDPLAGAAFFGSIPEPIPADEVFAIDAEMRAFVEREVGAIRGSEAKLRRLLIGMQQRGLLSLEYSQELTRPARVTFHERQGNCLSFTILFVTLAREAGLRARYQIVDVPPVWSSTEDVLVVSNHINVVVESDTRGPFVVDFNQVDARGNYEQRLVSDDHALALFYTNLGAEALIAGAYAASFGALRAALEVRPDLASAWSNLGLLYARTDRPDYAEAAYLRALHLEPRNGSVLTNLASLYFQTGQTELATVYMERIRAYQQRNPYYYYGLAAEAYRERRFADALDEIRTALRLKRDEHRFHFLQALAWHELGRPDLAERSIARAREVARYPELRARYTVPLETLARTFTVAGR